MDERGRSVDISNMKKSFAAKFPSHPLTRILLSEPDIVTMQELLAKSQTWLSFFHGGKENE
jgi:hypothetical protein